MAKVAPFLFAALLIGILEMLVGIVGSQGNYNSSFFDFSPLKNDVLQKRIIYDKFVQVLPTLSSDAVQVGDSSGFYGVIPSEVSKVATNISYLNLSCCGDTGWSGYYYQAELAMRRSPTPKILVLHITPWWSPAAEEFYGDNQLATSVKHNLLMDHWYYAIKPPSQGYRLRITNYLFHGVWQDEFISDQPAPQYPPMSEWRKMFLANRGYVPMPVDMGGPEVGICKLPTGYSERSYLGLYQRDSLYEYLKRFELLAERNGARFVFITNPVSCKIGEDSIYADIQRQLHNFQKDYPKATVAFTFLREWSGLDDFKDPYHLSPQGAIKHSQMIGEVLASVSK